ncbi:MAG: phosphatidate cytidylyltransferase [Tagaea sp.]|nr:phosphatidate cytidylyltransferase [Tagaea sp.]
MTQAAPSALRQRVVSGIVLAAVALAGLFSGREAFEIMLALCGAVLAWEWTRLVGDGRFGSTGVAVAFAALAAGAAAALARPGIGLLLCLAGTAIVFSFARTGERDHPKWLAAGPIYIGVPIVALIWLRGHDLAGLETILWLLACVWATDTGAYFFGRGIGGPRLAPAISPNKTWAGLLGGMACSAAVGIPAAWLEPAGPPAAMLAIAGAILAVIAQAGDLLESFVKRRFGAKDAGTLIPGHGGLFDRVDGMLAAAPALALFQFLTGGTVLAWP